MGDIPLVRLSSVCHSVFIRHLPNHFLMRQVAIGFSILALAISAAQPVFASAPEKSDGVPGRRVGGGTRWMAPRPKSTISFHNRLSAMSFASRTHLPTNLKLKAIYR
jgi:hypothetical protein